MAYVKKYEFCNKEEVINFTNILKRELGIEKYIITIGNIVAVLVNSEEEESQVETLYSYIRLRG